jgi:hypothetical protein
MKESGAVHAALVMRPDAETFADLPTRPWVWRFPAVASLEMRGGCGEGE